MATKAHKAKFLDKLEKGIMPLYAAKVCGISKATIYNWRHVDPQFAIDWDDALATGIDLVETKFIQRAIKHSDTNAINFLRAYKPEVYGRRETTTVTSTVSVKMTLEESKERLRQLGIELPAFEGDQIEDHTVPLIEDHATARDETEDDPSRDR